MSASSEKIIFESEKDLIEYLKEKEKLNFWCDCKSLHCPISAISVKAFKDITRIYNPVSYNVTEIELKKKATKKWRSINGETK